MGIYLKGRSFRAFFSNLVRPRSFGRFMLVGGVNTIVGVATFPFLFWLSDGAVGNNALLIVSSVFCAVFAYFTHRILTFRSKGAYHVEIGKFLILTLVVYLINLAVLNTIPRMTGIHPVAAQVVTTMVLSVILMALNYFGMNYFVFVSRGPK